jgi:pimeloyl-ACP methyl ester carboxylesterase
MGTRPDIMLLHGLTDNGRCWQRAAHALAGEYGTIMPDARGHGSSDTPATGYRVEDRVADALGLLDALEIKRIVVWGHSMGAATAAMLAATAPERVRAVILEDPPYMPFVPDSGGRRAGLEQQQALSHAELVAQGKASNPRWSEDTFEPWAEAKRQARLQVFDYVREASTPWQSFLGNIKAPALLITGDPALGALVSPQIAAEMQSLAPSLQVANVPRAGHCIRYEQFDAYMEAARGFLREVL